MSEIKARLEEHIGKQLRHNEPLSSYTLLKENTLAEFFLEVERQDDLVKAVQAAYTLKIPVVVLGSGSFLSLPDETIMGLVIKNNCRRFDKIGIKGKVRENEIGVRQVLIQAESGTLMNQLVRFTIEEGLEGLEYYLGMPGTVGGGIYTDAKYKRNHVRDCLQSVRILTKEGLIEMHTENLEEHLTDTILLSAIFLLTPASKKILWERGEEASQYRTHYNSR